MRICLPLPQHLLRICLQKKSRSERCKNCGSETHTEKSCFDRPRKIRAQYPNNNIALNDQIPNREVKLSFEEKRDRWDPDSDCKNYKRSAKDDADKASSITGVKSNPAKYLLRFHLGDNLYRQTGQAIEFQQETEKTRATILERYEDPSTTKAETHVVQDVTVAKDEYPSTTKDETDVVQGVTVAKSKYIEDLHPNNHTSVWGSWWKMHKWGYKCCHQMNRESYCTVGIEAHKEEGVGANRKDEAEPKREDAEDGQEGY